MLRGGGGESAATPIATSANSKKALETKIPALLNFFFTSDQSFSLISSVPLGARACSIGFDVFLNSTKHYPIPFSCVIAIGSVT